MPGSASLFGDRWPTTEPADNLVPGQLEWPTAEDWGSTHAHQQYLVWEPPNDLNSFVQYAPGRYLDSQGKLYQVSGYQGLRGQFYPEPGTGRLSENTDQLQRYQLWEWIGYGADEFCDANDVAAYTERELVRIRGLAVNAVEQGIPSARSMYFWDGVSRDGVNPKLTLYYTDGQGKPSTGQGEIGVDFYDMKLNAAADLYTKSVGGVEATPRHPGSFGVPPPGYEADAGPDAIEPAYQAVFATTLAWQRLSDWRRIHSIVGSQARRQRTGIGDLGNGNVGFVDTEATNTMYEMYRPRMLEVVANVFRNENRIGQIGGSPDIMQSRIQANLRTKLLAEGFAGPWIDVFFAEENVHTITPEGFDLFGTDQSKRPIPAGTDPEQIQLQKMNPGDYTTYPWIPPASPPASRVVVHAPFGYIVPPRELTGPRGGPPNTQLDNWARPQLLQKFPHDYTFAKYTLHTLNPKIVNDEIFYFDYAPSNVSYQGLGAQWVEVPRSGDLPIVEFSSWALMKVSMDFLIANTLTTPRGDKHPDGLVTGVYEKIETLRRMAQRPYPISVFGLDQLLRISMRRAEMIGKPLEFVISDLNISSMRRTIEEGDKEITTAQVKLTLQEMPVEMIKSVQFGKPDIVVPYVPGDASGSAAQSQVPPHEIARRDALAKGIVYDEREPYAMARVNVGSSSDAYVGTGAINRHEARAQFYSETEEGDYAGYNEWLEAQ